MSYNLISSFPIHRFPVSTITQLAIPLTLTIPLWIGIYTGYERSSDYLRSSEWRGQAGSSPEEYDFIIAGGGSAGAALANRLSLNNKVLLLELGGDPNPFSRLGLSYFLMQRCPGADLLYETVPQNRSAFGLNGRKVFWPRGTGIGGSSNLNAMIYQRGNPNDYDLWAQITQNPEWGWDNVLKYLKKLEDYHGDYPGEYHGTGGPMHVEKVRHSVTEKYFLQAAREKGYPVKDPNGIQTVGFSTMDVTMKNGLRWSTYHGYIKPILKRSNLKIYRFSRVVKVHLDRNKHAYGLTYYRHGQYRFVRARKEIILSAGAIDSPKILMLSGIGDYNHLHSVGLRCRVNLPMVGQNLQDHTLTIFGPFILDTPESLLLGRELRIGNVLDFLSKMRKGVLASTTHSGMGYVTSSVRNHDPNWPDIQYTLNSFGVFEGYDDILVNAFNVKKEILKEFLGPLTKGVGTDANFVGMALLRPKSVGEIKLASSNPFHDPIMEPNYFSHPDDIRAMVDGLKMLVDLYENTTAYKSINARLYNKPLPGCEFLPFKTEPYYECWLRHFTFTIYHPVGTAAMGQSLSDSWGPVTDSEMRVFKTKGLRVIDASIMPVIVNANTNIPSIMIGEIGSDFIRRYWQSQYSICNLFDYYFLYDDHAKCFYSKTV